MTTQLLAKLSDVRIAPHFIPKWREGVVGDVFINLDNVLLSFGDRVMYDCPTGDVIDFSLPATSPEDAGKRVAFGNVGDGTKSIGLVRLHPNGTDHIESFGDGEVLILLAVQAVPTFELEFVGDGRWMHTYPTLGTDQIFYPAGA
jgi:hypothetical protein